VLEPCRADGTHAKNANQRGRTTARQDTKLTRPSLSTQFRGPDSILMGVCQPAQTIDCLSAQ
jgi:hypothetical protein